MIIVYHDNYKVTEIVNSGEKLTARISDLLFKIAENNPNEFIVWCEESVRGALNIEIIPAIFHHNKIMASFSPSRENYLTDIVGYIDESLFVKPNKSVSFPTWQMSSLVGGVHASVLNAVNGKIKPNKDFDYFLNSISKIALNLGILCYSNPNFLKHKIENVKTKTADISQVFCFVKEHYRSRWMFLLLLNIFLYERQILLFPAIKSIRKRQIKLDQNNFSAISMNSTKNILSNKTIDVLIPTIGRKDPLFNFLKDLSSQALLPENVIIVEQNPEEGSVSSLDYIDSEQWPFKIIHVFTNKSGVCNARNIALEKLQSDWVFFADDDIRIEPDFFEAAFENISKSGNEAFTFNCLQANEKSSSDIIFQWQTFGSGCSFVKKEALKNVKFDMAYEFGFGEDADYGMQLRNKGYDILFLPEPKILHLKAPIGGFRTKFKFAWENEKIQPKPSPTVMHFKKSYLSKEQLACFKTILFFKYYKLQKIKNPFSYYKMFQKQWEQSDNWSNKLN